MNVLSKSRLKAALLSSCGSHIKLNSTLAAHHSAQGIVVKQRSSSLQHAFLPKSIITITRVSPKQECWLLSSSFNNVLLGNQHLSLYQDQSYYHTLCSEVHRCIVSGNRQSGNVHNCIRYKSKKKRSNTDTDSDSDVDDSLDDDDFDAPTQFKIQKIHSPSLRIDAVLSNALGLSRHRLEELFFGPGLLLNGKKLLKKGGKMDEGDYVDAVMEKSDGQIKVKRVKLMKIGSDKTSTDKFILTVRVWKSPFLIENPDK